MADIRVVRADARAGRVPRSRRPRPAAGADIPRQLRGLGRPAGCFRRLVAQGRSPRHCGNALRGGKPHRCGRGSRVAYRLRVRDRRGPRRGGDLVDGEGRGTPGLRGRPRRQAHRRQPGGTAGQAVPGQRGGTCRRHRRNRDGVGAEPFRRAGDLRHAVGLLHAAARVVPGRYAGDRRGAGGRSLRCASQRQGAGREAVDDVVRRAGGRRRRRAARRRGGAGDGAVAGKPPGARVREPAGHLCPCQADTDVSG